MKIILYVNNFGTLQYIEKTATMQNEDNQKYAPFDYHEFVQPQGLIQRPTDQDISTFDNIVFTDQPNIKVFCYQCRKYLNNTTSILSRDKTKNVYRCVGCFAKQTPNDIPYQVIRCLNFPIIEHNWKANQEILFLGFLQKHGFNNWADIKQQMEYYGSKFTATQLQNHYYEYYLSSDEFLPRILNNEDFFQKKQQQPKTVINPTSIASFSTNHREEQQQENYAEIEDFELQEEIKLSHEKKQRQKLKEKQSSPEFYNQKRKEFDVEYDPEAQLMLANLEFRDDDTQQEKRIKFQLIDLYNQRLEKRSQIKQFVIEHHLLDTQYQKAKHELRTEFEKQSFEQLKPVARFMKLTDFNALVQKVAFTKQLKSIIEGLRKFRRTHPSNFKSLDEFINSQPEQSRPKKKRHGQNEVRVGKKAQELLDKRFNLSRKQFQNIVTNLAANGKKTVYKNIQAVMLDRNSE